MIQQTSDQKVLLQLQKLNHQLQNQNNRLKLEIIVLAQQVDDSKRELTICMKKLNETEQLENQLKTLKNDVLTLQEQLYLQSCEGAENQIDKNKELYEMRLDKELNQMKSEYNEKLIQLNCEKAQLLKQLKNKEQRQATENNLEQQAQKIIEIGRKLESKYSDENIKLSSIPSFATSTTLRESKTLTKIPEKQEDLKQNHFYSPHHYKKNSQSHLILPDNHFKLRTQHGFYSKDKDNHYGIGIDITGPSKRSTQLPRPSDLSKAIINLNQPIQFHRIKK